ncbi:MAG: ABC transporter permease, partial [Chloroflexi bacterium]|nr:ABC transporter permease [Chloroflexota bacterium]
EPLLNVEGAGSGAQDTGIAVMTWEAVVISTLRGVTAGSVDAPIPVVASAGFMARGGYDVGERITVEVLGNRVPVRLAGVADYFPTLDPEFSAFLVGDIRSTWLALNANRMRIAEQANEIWIDTGAAAPSDVGSELRRGSPSALSVIAQDQLLRDASVDPLISAGWRALLAIAFTTVLTASAVGFLVYSQVTFASRMTEYAVVRTLGLTTRQVLGLVTLELTMVLVPAVIIGAVLGMRMGATIIPFLVTSGEGVRVVPPVVLDIDWRTIGVLVGVVGAIFLAISIGLISSVRNISPPRVMRMGQK